MSAVNFTIPKDWEALTERQLLRIAPLFFKSLKPLGFDVRILLELLNLRWYHLKRYARIKWALRAIPISDIKKSYLWIYKPSGRLTFIPRYKKLKSPHAFLLDLTIGEFAIVDDLYRRFQESKDPATRRSLMEMMAAVLYVPNGYPRAKFKKEAINKNVPAFAKAPTAFLYAMIVSYQGCRNGLEKRYNLVFPKAQTATKDLLKAPKKQYGFGKVILNMAGGKFGNFAETSATPLHTFMEQFNEDLKK